MTDTYVDNLAGEEIVFQFGDGGGPETFAASCSINTDRKLDLTSEIYSSTSPNCTDPSKPAKKRNRVKSQDVKFSGSGMADAASYKTLINLWKAGVPFNGIVAVLRTGSTLQITGSWLVESIGLGGAATEDATFEISIVSRGDWVIA